MIQSEAWKLSMQGTDTSETDQQADVSSSADTDEGLAVLESKADRAIIFEERYTILVKRAYFKIIAEAEAADSRLKHEYNVLMQRARELQNSRDRDAERKLEGARKKYEAHREMLEGLKSWNILSEFGSDDIKFFKAENREKVLQMYKAGQQEERIIYYLIYKLADLYHFEE